MTGVYWGKMDEFGASEIFSRMAKTYKVFKGCLDGESISVDGKFQKKPDSGEETNKSDDIQAFANFLKYPKGYA